MVETEFEVPADSSLPRHVKRGPPAAQGTTSKRRRRTEAPAEDWLTHCLNTTGLSSLLTQGVLGRLDLQTWQALASTSRACRRALDGAQDVLAQLAQIKLPNTLGPPEGLDQARMHQELNAIARLHAAMRRGAANVTEGPLLEVSCLPAASISDCSMSPTGTAAALVWDTKHEAEEQESGIVVAYQNPGTAGWTAPITATLRHTVSRGCMAWSASGRFYGSLHTPAGDRSCLMLRCFDTSIKAWLPHLLVPGVDLLLDPYCLDYNAPPSFSHDETLVAIPVEACGIVILGVQQRTVRLMVTFSWSFRSHAMVWLSGSNNLVILDLQAKALAVAAWGATAGGGSSGSSSSSSSSQQLQPRWVPDTNTASQPTVTEYGALDILPSGLILVAYVRRRLHATSWGGCGTWKGFHFLAYDQDLQTCSSHRSDVLCDSAMHEFDGVFCNIVMGPRALAVTLSAAGESGTWLYELPQGNSAIGDFMFMTSYFEHACFSHDGHFLAGKYAQCKVQIIDCRTGYCLVSMQPSGSWPGMPAGCKHTRPSAAVWAGQQVGQLLIMSYVSCGTERSTRLHSTVSF